MKLPYSEVELAEFQQEVVEWWRDHDHRGIMAFPLGLAGTVTAHTALSDPPAPSVTLVLCSTAREVKEVNEDLHEIEGASVFTFSPSTNENRPSVSRILTDVRSGNLTHVVLVTTFHTLQNQDSFSEIRSKDEFLLQLFLPKIDSLPETVVEQLDNLEPDRILGLSMVPEDRLDRIYGSGRDRRDRYARLVDEHLISYPLEKAIEDRFLRPFKYYPIFTRSSADEMEVLEERFSKVNVHDGEAQQTALFNAKQATRAAGDKINIIDKLLQIHIEVPAVFFCRLVQTGEEICDLLHSQERSFEFLNASEAQPDQIISDFRNEEFDYLVSTTASLENYELGFVETAVLLSASQHPLQEYQSLNQVLLGTEWRNAKHKPVDIFDIIAVPHPRYQGDDHEVEQLLRESTGLMKILIDASVDQHKAEYRLYRQLDEFGFGQLVYK